MSRLLKNSVWALSGFSLLALGLTRELETLTLLSIFTLFPLFYFYDRKSSPPRIRWLENSLILSGFAFALYRFRFLKDSFLLIVADFLVFFLLLKAAFRKDQGDLIQMIYLSFFILLSCSTLSLDFTFLLSFAAYIVLASWTLSVLHLSEPQNPIPISKPENETLLRQTLARQALLTLASALIFAVGIFIFFPRFSFAIFQGAFLGPVHQSGFTEKVTLEKSGKIFKDSKVVMRVEILEPAPKTGWKGPLYLRGQALSSFDGKTWSRGPKKDNPIVFETVQSRALKMQKVIQNQFNILNLSDRELLKSELAMKCDESSFLKQRIYLESLDTSLLFAAPWAETIAAKLPQISVLQDFSLQRPGNFKGRISYEVTSLIERPAEKQLGKRRTFQLPFFHQSQEEELAIDMHIPQNPEDLKAALPFERIQKLINQIISRRDSGWVKAKKIEKYLRQNYLYTLDLKGNPEINPLEDFLFGTKEGHCEYFASAMALMLRMEGIPARIATGFLMDEKNSSGGYYVVRAQDAHAWVEACLGGVWVEFDPTPRVSRFEAEKLSPWQKARQYVDTLNFLWNYYVLGYDAEHQEKAARNAAIKSGEISVKLDRVLGKWRRRIMPQTLSMNRNKGESNSRLSRRALFGLLALILGVLAGIKLKYYFKYNKIQTGSLEFYQKLLRILARRGIRRRGGETPAEFSHRIGCEYNSTILKNEINLLTDLFYQVRYGGIKLDSEQTSRIIHSLKKIQTI